MLFQQPQDHSSSVPHMSYTLNSLKGVTWGIIYGTTIGVTKGDTRSLDNGSNISGLPNNECLSWSRGPRIRDSIWGL